MKTLLHFLLFLALALLPAHGQGLLSLAGSPPAAGGGVSPTLVASDNFDSYIDLYTLESDANWNAINGSIIIRKPAADGTISGVMQSMCYHTGTFSANQRCEVTITTLGGSFDFICAGVRCQTGADTRYWFQSDGTNWYLVHRLAGSESVLASGTHTTLTTGDKIALEVTGASTAARLTAQFYHSSTWTSVTGATSLDPGSGKYIDGGAPGVGGAGGLSRGDNFAGYDL